MNRETDHAVKALKAHLALNVRSVEHSIEFYRRMLGLEPSKVRIGYAKFDVQNPPLNLTLNEIPFNERGALSHLGIQLASTDDVLAMRQRWDDAGLSPRDEMQVNCCYAVQDKTWVRDPDGNEWEAFVVLEDNLSETEMCGDGDAKSCGVAPSADSAPVDDSKSREIPADTASPNAVACCGTIAPAPVGISR